MVDLQIVAQAKIGEEIYEEEEKESNGSGLEGRRRRTAIEDEVVITETDEGLFEKENEIVEEQEKDSNLQNGSKTIINAKSYDFEKVLEEQETHDLYCPNCKSCITKRVILKKRRKTVTEIESEFRPFKIPNLGIKSDILNEPLLHQNDDEREQHILFKCLSCFTFFIPTDWIQASQESKFEFNKEPKYEVQNVNNSKSKGESRVKTNTNDSNNWSFDIFGFHHKKHVYKPGGKNDEIEETESISTETHTDIQINQGAYIPPPLFPTIPPPEMKIPTQKETPINPNQGPVLSRQEEITIMINERPMNCSLCPGINNWDIIKPIIYGGLIEIITSLSVVSSAAATGSTTLNIFLLGIANLIGGFILLIHELMELKRAQDETGDLNRKELGRYFALLGQKGHFGLHAILAIFSYLFFGLLPPVIYGFTFRQTDDSEYKIISVGLSAIFCVAILAIGKAHVSPQRNYFKTLFYYVGIAVQSSGLSYAGGILVKKLVKKLGLFDEGSLGVF